MNNLEQELRGLFERRADDVRSEALSVTDVLRWSKRKRAMNLTVFLIVLLMGFVGAARAWSWDWPAATGPGGQPTRVFHGEPGPMRRGDDPSTKGRVELVTGRFARTNWVVSVEPRPRGYCTNLIWNDRTAWRCWTRADQKQWGATFISTPSPNCSFADGAGDNMMLGALSRDVIRVEVDLDHYKAFTVPVIRGPAHPPQNFFVGFFPDEATGKVNVYDRNGQFLRKTDMKRYWPRDCLAPRSGEPDF
jgi:hypothetical protein